MMLLRAFKSVIHKTLAHFGYRITTVGRRPDQMLNSFGVCLGNTMQSTISRIKNIGINPTLIFDIGAARGSWTQEALAFWPEAKYIWIEPLSEQISRVPEDLRSLKQISIHESVAGEAEGQIEFNVSADLDGSGIYNAKSGNSRNVKVVTIDSLYGAIGSVESVLLKLDTHGYEVPIFEGAEKVLGSTTVVIVEVYGFYVSPTAKLFHEISMLLDEKGFRLFDIVDVTRRDKDGAFWQADAVYIRKHHPNFTDNAYR